MKSLEAGVEATVRLAISPDLEGISGYFFHRQSETPADTQAYDPEAALPEEGKTASLQACPMPPYRGTRAIG